MTEAVRWAEIVAECGDFRAGFVSVFRKYEGQPTDERDRQNRVVKVTAASFARHMGIGETTFKDWIKKQDGAPRRVGSGSHEKIEEALRTRPQEHAEAIAKALEEPEVAEKVIRAMRPRATDQLDKIEHKVTMERLTAQQRERDTTPRKPTVRDLVGEDVKGPDDVIFADQWIDGPLFRTARSARMLKAHLDHYGLVIGSTTAQHALELAEKAEENIAAVRAALQERVRDLGPIAAAMTPQK